MIYGETVGKTKYLVINMMDLPSDVRDESCNDSPGNDTARIINPEYNPKLAKWLVDNGHDATKCYIAWWSW